MSEHSHPRVATLVLILLLVECFCIPALVDSKEHAHRNSSPSRRSPHRHPKGTEHKGHGTSSSRNRNGNRRVHHHHQGGGGGGGTAGSRGMIVTYWGQFDHENSLIDACRSRNYNIIILSFLDFFGHNKKPRLNLAGHCDPGSGGCKGLGADIQSCQGMGVPILLSIGGADGGYGLDSVKDAEFTALHIWNSYLGGSSNDDERPLGPAVLNGVDFDIEKGKSEFYATLAKTLKFLMLKFGRRSGTPFFLGAAPQCPFQDEFMGPGPGTALGSGVFDYVWVQFYNNEECHYDPKRRDPSRVLDSWTKWTSALPHSKIFLGLPASLDASTDSDDENAGFMPIDVFVNQVSHVIKKSPNYGGVMLWSYYYDVQSTHGKDRVFSQAIKGAI
ncbi:hypothetical protein Mapa_006063 [Marchantia paleacea]|nr:hypothetical protein Mapa_006063 [Marchantia paleacea]